jgi:hypothetical protein
MPYLWHTGSMSQTRSAYPPDIEDLMPAARDLTADLGSIPSRNRLMRELKVGAPKATEVRDALVGEAIGDELDPDLDEHPNGSAGHPVNLTGHEVAESADPDTGARRKVHVWPVFILCTPAWVAIWSGWVGLGGLTGFGPVNLLPGIGQGFTINTAITLPVGMETYAAYALWAWLTPGLPTRAQKYARWSSILALSVGCSGQIAYHLMTAAYIDHAPWLITTLVGCVPVAVAGMGAALAHLLRNGEQQ